MFIGDMCHGIRFQVFIHLGSKMHENKSLMLSNIFQNKKTPLILGVHNFLIGA